MNTMIRVLEATLTELVNRYNETPTTSNYNRVRAVRLELVRVRQGGR